MHSFLRPRLDLAAAGLAAVTAAAVLTAPPPAVAPPPPTITADVRLAATSVPPGGLIVSFWRNQAVYCSLICPLLAQTGVTAAATTLQAPGRFLTALSAGDVLKAVGAAVASVTGPTRAAAQRAIDVDQAIPAQRALNAFEVGVVGLLDVLPAARGGIPAVVSALDRARRDTYAALNLPFVPNPEPTVQPRGVFQVAVIAAIDVVAAVIFPAFNTVLAGVFAVPDAVAQELARTGNPVRALRAGANTAAEVVNTAGGVIKHAVVDAVDDIRAAADPRQQVPSQPPSRTERRTPTAVAPSAAADDEVVSRGEEQIPPTPRRHRQPDPLRATGSELRPAEQGAVRAAHPGPVGEETDTETHADSGNTSAHDDSGDAPEHEAGDAHRTDRAGPRITRHHDGQTAQR
ncbi:hypothetical protein V4U86_08420 [Mycobacterium sp. AMU20-3851]|uniref:hypothetical protein n=1 Tax=Mycobacterium sp. AMU20-3851 TaxID=3122055 RepID=UPI0037551EA4